MQPRVSKNEILQSCGLGGTRSFLRYGKLGVANSSLTRQFLSLSFFSLHMIVQVVSNGRMKGGRDKSDTRRHQVCMKSTGPEVFQLRTPSLD